MTLRPPLALLIALTAGCAVDADVDGPLAEAPDTGTGDTSSQPTDADAGRDAEPAADADPDAPAADAADLGPADTSPQDVETADSLSPGDTDPGDTPVSDTDPGDTLGGDADPGDTLTGDTTSDGSGDTAAGDTAAGDTAAGDTTSDGSGEITLAETVAACLDLARSATTATPLDAGCPTTLCAPGYRCDASGYCARPPIAERFVEGSGDPGSGFGMPATYAPSPGSSVADIAPLDCRLWGCAAGFVCGADGGCAADCVACGGDCDYEARSYFTRNHIAADLLYAGLPTGGNHHTCWATWGLHTHPAGDEHWVHNLEHGGVALLFRCADGCETERAQLEALTACLPAGTVVLTPEPTLTTPFAAVAWGYRLELGCFDLDAIADFYLRHQGHGPEATSMPPPPQCL